MKDNRKAADFIISIVLLVMSAFLFMNAMKMPSAEKGIGPGDYPKFICAVLFFLSLVQLVSVIASVKGIPLIDFKQINTRYLLRALIMVAATFVYYKLMKPVGFLIMTPLYLFGSFMLFGYKKKVKGAVIAIVFSVAVYLLFTKVFMVFLPRGILG
ncbi:MAG: tripartite tricarboxylate transporter TctB family protein [Bullifex sp.]